MAKEYYKEGSHLIRRVIKLPNQGSGNYLYSIIGEDEFDFLYRWLPDNTWEEIPLTFGRGRTYVEQGDNVILLGDGSEENPYIVNAITEAGGELEKISRSGREFYRLKGQPDQNFALGGKYSINFSRSTDLTGVMGPTGESSVQFSTNSVTSGKRSMTVGENNINPHNETFVVGNTARGQVSNTYSSANIIISNDFGRGGTRTYNNLYGNIIGGSDSEIGTEGANLNTAVVYGSIVYGINNNVYAAESSLYAGHALTGGASRCAVVGTANIDLTATTATQKTQSNSAYNPRFIVGVGDWNSETNSGTRANGFVVMSDGTSNFPSLTNTKIDNSSDYSAVTKGWVNHAIGNISTGIGEAPQDGNQYARENASWVEVEHPVIPEFPEAPQDGKYYARRNENWSEVIHPPFPEAPNDNKIYGRKDSSWIEVTSEEFPEAPQDGKLYARRDSDWSEVVHPPFPEAPQDGNQYARENGDWVEVEHPVIPAFPEAPQDGKYYARRDSDWSEVVHPPFPEAPQDNKEYARKNAGWVVVTDTSYDKGTLQHLIDGTSEVFMVWSSAVLKQWIDERLKPILIKKSSTFALNSSHNNNIIGLEDVTCNIDPTQLEENGFSVSFKNTTDATTSFIDCNLSLGYDYKLNTEARVFSKLIKIHPGQTCTVTKFPGDSTIYIDGDVE